MAALVWKEPPPTEPPPPEPPPPVEPMSHEELERQLYEQESAAALAGLGGEAEGADVADGDDVGLAHGVLARGLEARLAKDVARLHPQDVALVLVVLSF